MSDLAITQQCPKCFEQNCLSIQKNKIICDKCNFAVQYRCALCNASLEDCELQTDSQGDFFNCDHCKKDIHLKRIQTIINNLMNISHDHHCKYCNGPTLYRTQANLGHRCFYFPKCSGQSSLFGKKKECLVFLDFETSGLEAGKDHIIEIGALKIDEDGFEHIYETFIKPPVPLPPKITQITKITDEMLESAPVLEDVIQSFYDFVGNATIVAHNAEFDITWLIINFMNHNLPLQDNEVICTFKWAKEMKEGRSSLSALTKKYKIGHLNAHRALADAAVTKELFFIYEAAQTVPRPIKQLDSYMKIVNKIRPRQKEKEFVN